MKYFGTDGIRGVVDCDLDSRLAYKVGIALGKQIIDNNQIKIVVIGNDTRVSNDVLKYSLACGLMDMGVDCIMVGIVPTACISYLVPNLNVSYGIMITASHNTWEMNGIKIFNEQGYKLDIEEELELEQKIDSLEIAKSSIKGRIYRSSSNIEQYIEFIKREISINLSQYNIALDMANGSNYNIAPLIFKSLGANTICIGQSNDGRNINNKCGAQHIEYLKKEVLSHNCDFGFAFDGDADRLRVVLQEGRILDGDDILYIFAKYLKKNNKLDNNIVVGTIMSNLGLERALNALSINLSRVDVGDKNVIRELKDCDCVLGGEPSGHIALLKYNTSCDALFNALFLLKILVDGQINLQETLQELNKVPVIERNIAVSNELREKYKKDQKLEHEINNFVDSLNFQGKVIVRPSGTEPVFRIYVESDNEEENVIVVNKIENYINSITL